MVHGRNIGIMETYGIRKIMLMEKPKGYLRFMIPMENYVINQTMSMERNMDYTCIIGVMAN